MRKALMAAASVVLLSIATHGSAQAPAAGAPAWAVGGKDAAWFAGRPGRPDTDSETIAPFKVVGDLYYVGANNIAALLLVTPQGHILFDTGTTKMAATVIPNIVKLGFKPQDIKIILVSHAHFDHVQTTEIHRRITGAQMIALDAEAPALSTGHDLSSLESEGFEPIKIDRTVKSGEVITLGGATVKVIWTPGHTPGTATYVITTQEGGRTYNVMYGGPPTPVTGNPKFNTPVAAANASYAMLRTVNPDMIIGGHPASFGANLQGLMAQARPSPLQLAPGAWAKMVDDAEAGYKKRLADAGTGARTGD